MRFFLGGIFCCIYKPSKIQEGMILVQSTKPQHTNPHSTSRFLAWYHDHPFEIDQRGLHVFLGLPAGVPCQKPQSLTSPVLISQMLFICSFLITNYKLIFVLHSTWLYPGTLFILFLVVFSFRPLAFTISMNRIG